MRIAIEEKHPQNPQKRDDNTCDEDAEKSQAEMPLAQFSHDEGKDEIPRSKEHGKHG